MGRPRFHPMRNGLAAIGVAGAMLLSVAAPAAAAPWQQAWGDYDKQQQWHDASWWLQNQHEWVVSHHPEWTDNYAATPGQIGDSDRFHGRHYGDGGTDRTDAVALEAVKNERLKASTKTEASVKNAS
ncbi:MAG: hypothetical protein WA827_16285 [Candidatus Binatus sp.]